MRINAASVRSRSDAPAPSRASRLGTRVILDEAPKWPIANAISPTRMRAGRGLESSREAAGDFLLACWFAWGDVYQSARSGRPQQDVSQRQQLIPSRILFQTAGKRMRERATFLEATFGHSLPSRGLLSHPLLRVATARSIRTTLCVFHLFSRPRGAQKLKFSFGTLD